MILDCSELIQSLIEDLNAIQHPYPEEKIDALERHSRMLITRIWGEDSHYLSELKAILHPIVASSGAVQDVQISAVEREDHRQKKWEGNRVRIANVFNVLLMDKPKRIRIIVGTRQASSAPDNAGVVPTQSGAF